MPNHKTPQQSSKEFEGVNGQKQSSKDGAEGKESHMEQLLEARIYRAPNQLEALAKLKTEMVLRTVIHNMSKCTKC